MYPILIPSLHRANRKINTTASALHDEGTQFYLVVHPDEEYAYRTLYPNATILPTEEQGKGIRAVRQWMLDYARKQEWQKYWQLDDDLKFKKFEMVDSWDNKGKLLKSTITDALMYGEQMSDGYSKVALLCFNHSFVAFHSKHIKEVNKWSAASVLTRTDTAINYNEGEIEDLGFTLQHLQAGWNTLLLNYYTINTPQHGSGRAGGCEEYYRTRRDEQMVDTMVEKYKGILTVLHRKNGRKGVKVSWRKFNHPLV